MAHIRRPTPNSLHKHTPTSLDLLTLASHNKPQSNRFSSISPLQSSSLHSNLPPASRPDEEDNDFQSNARNGSTCSSFSTSRLAGLGITYPERPAHYPKASLEEVDTLYLGSATRALSPVDLLQPHLDDENVHLGDFYLPSTSWSSCSLSRATSETIEMTGPLSQGATLQIPHLEGATEIAFSSIAAASGMSVDSLAEQLSATADLALQYLADNPYTSFPALGSSVSLSQGSLLDELLEDQHTSWPVLAGNRHDISLVPQVRTCSEAWMEPSLAVNPADTLSETLSEASHQYPFLPSNSAGSGFSSLNIFDGLLSTKEETLDDGQLRLTNGIEVDTEEVTLHARYPPCHEVFPPMKDQDHNSDYELSDSDYSSSSFPSPRQNKRVRTAKRTAQKSTRKPAQKIQLAVEKPAPQSATVRADNLPQDLDLGTPVFNAHKGISLKDLKAKAERYRLRNAGRMYDNAWLVSFVGKLSSRGGLVEDYRCYIEGCTQTNKRRDHILIHVGSHLDQRPYACAFCPSQFLRKNECKRHELSHSGTKPYVCDLCPDTAFVRQDLLRRHAARAHGITTARKRKSEVAKSEGKENARVRPSKRVKKKNDT